MSAPVDVLAVLDESIRSERESGNIVRSYRLQSTRAAVAALIEAVEATRATRGGIMALAASDARVIRLWSTLARVKGGAA